METPRNPFWPLTMTPAPNIWLLQNLTQAKQYYRSQARLPGRLPLSSHTACASVHFARIPIDHHRGLLNISQPTAVGPVLGMTYVMPESRALTAKITTTAHEELPRLSGTSRSVPSPSGPRQ